MAVAHSITEAAIAERLEVAEAALARAISLLAAAIRRERNHGGYATPADQRDHAAALALLIEHGKLDEPTRERHELAHATWEAARR